MAREAEAPAASKAERPVWKATELRAFLEGAKDDRLYALWHTAATTGLRRGELAGLAWSDIDLDAGTVTVRSNRVTVGYRVETTTPKSNKAAVLGLDADTVTVLRGHRARQAQERLAWGPTCVDSGLVFTRENGEGYHPQRIAQIFDRLVTRSALPRLTLHGLRHSYATAALEAGVDLKTVSSRLRHSSIAITGDVYAHTLKHMDQAAADTTAAFILGSKSS